MRRGLFFALVITLGCASDETDPDCPGLGCPADTGTASSASTVAASTDAMTTSATATSASTTADATTGASSSDAGDDLGESSTSPSTTNGSSSGESSTGIPCEGKGCPALAECFGLGVWQSCAQYCTAGQATCVVGGCGGATVVYYDDVDACIAMEPSGESAQDCDAAFMQGGGVSFGRCCCD